MVALKLPDVPVIVSVYVPTVAALVAANVNVLLFEAGLGFHNAVTPLGSPEIENVTLPVNPYCALT